MLYKDCERTDGRTDRRTTTTTDGEWSQYLTLSLRLKWANNNNSDNNGNKNDNNRIKNNRLTKGLLLKGMNNGGNKAKIKATH